MSNKELSPITTVRLGDHLPLLEILPDSNPLAWVRSGEGLVGWGVYATKTVTGPNRFAEARAWWEKQLENFVVTNSVHGSGTGPVLFASFSFSPNDESVLVIPNIVVGSKKDKSWITWIGSEQQPILNSSPDFVQNAQMQWSNKTDSESKSESEWKEKVSTAVGRIKEGSLAKVVLARDLTFRSEKDIDPRPILLKLASEYPTTWT